MTTLAEARASLAAIVEMPAADPTSRALAARARAALAGEGPDVDTDVDTLLARAQQKLARYEAESEAVTAAMPRGLLMHSAPLLPSSGKNAGAKPTPARAPAAPIKPAPLPAAPDTAVTAAHVRQLTRQAGLLNAFSRRLALEHHQRSHVTMTTPAQKILAEARSTIATLNPVERKAAALEARGALLNMALEAKTEAEQRSSLDALRQADPVNAEATIQRFRAQGLLANLGGGVMQHAGNSVTYSSIGRRPQ